MLLLLVKRLFCNFTTKLSNLSKLSNLDQNYDVGKLTNHRAKKFIRRLFVSKTFVLLWQFLSKVLQFDIINFSICPEDFFVRSKRKIPLFPEMRVMRKIFSRATVNLLFLINLIESFK